jgi:two-component sensor histidine kinase
VGIYYFSARESRFIDKLVEEDLRHHLEFYKELFPLNFHDEVHANFYTFDQYQKILERNNKISKAIGVQYLWSVIEVSPNDVRFTSSTTSDHNFKTGKHAWFWERHRNPESFAETFKTMQPTYSTFKNEWGEGRQLLMPYMNEKGQKYAYGISRNIEEIIDLHSNAFMLHFFVGISVLIVCIVIGWLLFHYIPKPGQQVYDKLDAYFKNQGLYKKTDEENLERVNRGLDLLLNSRMDFSTLLKEVNHRVKNIYQFFNSYLSITEVEVSDPKAKAILHNLRDMVQGMALLHEDLYLHDGSGVIRLQSYLSSLAKKLHASFFYGDKESKLSVKFTSSIETHVSPEQAINVGMILNELMINSMKASIREGKNRDIYLNLYEKSGQLKIGYFDTGAFYTEGHILNNPKRGIGSLIIDSMLNKLKTDKELISLNDCLFYQENPNEFVDTSFLPHKTVVFTFAIKPIA